ncbi:MAG: class I SAM-dependent methyltransferase, partial [Candidatus Heimdallarchaeota archaeon]|nr:class I SAM-dependent methyltransferase [Candidatus Heimdallarchaeota archaeon]
MIKKERIKYFDLVAPEREKWRKKSVYYHKQLEKYLQYLIPSNSSVIEIGCGTGDLVAALNPKKGLGIDISPEMVKTARKKFSHIRFEVGDLENLHVKETFDYVVVVETIGHVD